MVNNLSRGTSYQVLETEEKANVSVILFFKHFFRYVVITNKYFNNPYKMPLLKVEIWEVLKGSLFRKYTHSMVRNTEIKIFLPYLPTFQSPL